jgi:non-ribosomal peptide synthetase component F
VPRDWAPAHAGIRVHRSNSLAARDSGRIERVRITDPARTVFDLAAELTVAELETVFAEAEHRHSVTLAALADQLDRYRGRPGAGTLRALLERGAPPARTRSKAEATAAGSAAPKRLPRP